MWLGGIPRAGQAWVGAIPLADLGGVSLIPAIPTGLVATPGAAVVSIAWTPGDDATSWTLYWSTTPGVTSSSNALAGVTTPYNHTGRTNGQSYYYRLSATSAAGESGLSTEVSATPQGAIGTLQTDWIT